MMPSLPRIMPLLASALVLLSTAPEARADPTRRTLARPKKATEGGGLRASSRKVSETTTFHYPDAAAGGCRQGSSEGLAAWTTAHEENGYLFRDVLSCCAAHFAEDPDACLAASEEVHAMEVGRASRKLASSTGTTAAVQHRRLGKSNKSGKQAKYHKPNPWKKPPRPPQPKPQKVHGWNGTYGGWQKPKSGKTSKSSKSKSSKTVYKPPYKPRTRDPTPRPTPKPTPRPTPKPSRKPVVDENMVEITMGGMLVAHNLDVPPAGSEEMAKLAGVFEKTILTVLEEGFECDVLSIGGVSTGSHNMFEGRRLGGGTGLGKEVDALSADEAPAPSSDVLFHLRIVKPCPGCSKTDALVMASKVFEETFQQIEEKAESGELTVIFCIYAEVAQLVTEPCQVTISSAEGTSLAIDMEGGDVPSAPTTPRPTPLPIMPKDPTPQPSPKPVSTKPVMEWPPTPMPTEQPATPAPTDPPVVAPPITAFPTRAPVVGEVPADPTTSPVATVGTKSPTASKPSETKTPTIAPVSQPVTMPPAMIEQTTSPTVSPVAAPVSASPTVKPATASPTSYEPTVAPSVGSTSVATVTSSPVAGATAPPTTKAPSVAGASVAPTSIPPGAVYYTSFESGALTEGLAEPEWTNSADYAPWGHTTDQAATGIYSMKTPRFDLDDTTPKTSNLTLAYTDEDFEGGTLVFSVWSGTAMPVDALWIYVDGNMMGDLGMLKQDFEVQFIPLAPGPHNITWSYKWNPAPVPAFPPLPPGRIGAAFLDEVYILPLGVTIAPTDPPAATTTTAPVAAPVTTASPTLPEPDVPTPTTPVPVPTAPTTIAPTSIPPGALYYKSFEQGDFPADPEWMTEGDGLWELTTERATSGVYSIRSPVFFDPEDITPKTANVTMVTNPNWEATTLVFSAFAGVEMPFDDVRIIIDGMDRGNLANMQGFERQQIPLSPGPHVITWSYKYNPASVDAFPPTMPGRLGAAFIDDVYFLPVGATVSPTGPPVSEPVTTAAPTPATSAVDPTPVPAPTTIAPTSLPPGAIYFDGFEQGTFPDDDPEWTTEGDGLWELTTERANSGVYSIRSPDFFNPDDTTQKTANVTLRTNPNWDAGALIFSAMAGTNIPFDDFVYYVDGIMRGRLEMMTEFEPTRIELGPGPHEITWSYKYSPIDGLEFFPPAPPDRIGAVFLDDVHFVPFGAGGDTPAPTGGSPAVSVAPTPLPAPTTIAPTSLPPGAIYFDGFEQGTFPEGDPEWTTAGDGLWALSTERANSGVYSIESPVFDMDDVTPKVANVTLRTNPAWEAGSIVFSVLAGTNLPFDDLVYYVDGVARGSVDEGMTDFQQETIPLSPGGHIVTFSYRWNNPGVSTFPPAPPGRIGTVFIDDVYFMPEGVEILPTEPPASGPAPTPVPTVAPVVGGEEVPPVVGDPDMFFDGFETGDFTGLEWVIDGEQVWMVDDTNPFEGTYSAHINSADISISGGFAELNLPVSLDEASFIQFYFYAPVAMPFENFELRVDGQFLTGLNTDDETWTQAGAILSAGEHIVSWRLTKNPSGVPDELLGTLPKPPFWTGEAWLDNVALLPSTSSFSEGWESGDFTANPWVLSGDGEWSITDSKAVEGSYSATIASDDIDVDAAGVAELSIDIITEQGGTLAFQVLPSIEGPFEIANVLVDDIAVLTYSAVLDDWQPQMIDVQPGKRTVTFQLVKNPGGVPAEIISTLPSPPGREGQIWVDDIVFTANEAPPS